MKKIAAILTVAILVLIVSACGSANNASDQNTGAGSVANTVSDGQNSGGARLTGSHFETDKDGYVVLKGITDLTPHSELIEFVEPALEKRGIKIDLVSTASDAVTNERVSSGEIDFNFCQHLPYLEEYNETNSDTLVSAGGIHIEPIAAYSEKYEKLEDVPDNASIVVPNDATNEYRALKIIEEAGFIKLDENLSGQRAGVTDIKEYIKPVTIKEIDSAQIIGLANDFDIYITNTNKAIEAGIDTSKYLFRESEDSPYANIITVRAEDKDDPAVTALVEELKSDETKKFIEEHYNGAVIPAK